MVILCLCFEELLDRPARAARFTLLQPRVRAEVSARSHQHLFCAFWRCFTPSGCEGVLLCGLGLHLLDDRAPFSKIFLAAPRKLLEVGCRTHQKGGDWARCPAAEDVMWAPAMALPHGAEQKDLEESQLAWTAVVSEWM